MNAGSGPGATLQFRLTCERHRTFFLDIMHKHRIHDPARMEHVRLEFVKYVSSVYPASYVKHLQESSCMGCAFEAAGESCQAWALETLTAFCRGVPPPPAVFKTWLDKSMTKDMLGRDEARQENAAAATDARKLISAVR